MPLYICIFRDFELRLFSFIIDICHQIKNEILINSGIIDTIHAYQYSLLI